MLMEAKACRSASLVAGKVTLRREHAGTRVNSCSQHVYQDSDISWSAVDKLIGSAEVGVSTRMSWQNAKVPIRKVQVLFGAIIRRPGIPSLATQNSKLQDQHVQRQVMFLFGCTTECSCFPMRPFMNSVPDGESE